jgi:hypothetical protein
VLLQVRYGATGQYLDVSIDKSPMLENGCISDCDSQASIRGPDGITSVLREDPKGCSFW